MLIGFISGILATVLNSKKRWLNSEGVNDSLGSSITFLIPSFLGGIYSSILFATNAYGPTNTTSYVQQDPNRSNFGQGGFQLIGIVITVGIAVAAGLLIGLLSKILKSSEHKDLFNDNAYIDHDS